jgi:tetratricopeptide (TPR) repeat protein
MIFEMKKTVLIIGVLALALIGTLYSLPKIVVNNKSETTDQGTSAGTGEENNSVAEKQDANHGVTTLDAAQQETIDKLLISYQADPEEETGAIKLSDQYFMYQRFDSAAYYAEKAAFAKPNLTNYLRAGDRYYEAYGFSLDQAKSKRLGEKTREFYQKVLDENPTVLLAKANMAMTYVNTENPMQGIMMLREVLEDDPTNEVALFNMGILSMRSNQYSKAVERFQQIVVNNPSNTKARFYLGVSLMEANKKDEALKELKLVKEQEKDPAILQAIAELEGRLQ